MCLGPAHYDNSCFVLFSWINGLECIIGIIGDDREFPFRYTKGLHKWGHMEAIDKGG